MLALITEKRRDIFVSFLEHDKYRYYRYPPATPKKYK
jgi:hypothetical protein